MSLWLGTKARMSSKVLNFTINVFWFYSCASAHRCFRTPPNSVTTHWVRMCHENILIANVISNEAVGRESHISPLSCHIHEIVPQQTHPGTHSVRLSSLSTLPALQKINHRSQLMSPIMASCDCPFIIPLIITIIIIIISSLQFVTPCPKEDGIMFQIVFLLLFFFVSFLIFLAKFTGRLCNYGFSLKKKWVACLDASCKSENQPGLQTGFQAAFASLHPNVNAHISQ